MAIGRSDVSVHTDQAAGIYRWIRPIADGRRAASGGGGEAQAVGRDLRVARTPAV